MNMMPSFKEPSGKTVLGTHPITALVTSERVPLVKMVTVSKPLRCDPAKC